MGEAKVAGEGARHPPPLPLPPPHVIFVPPPRLPVPRHLVHALVHQGRDGVTVEVPARHHVLQRHQVPVTDLQQPQLQACRQSSNSRDCLAHYRPTCWPALLLFQWWICQSLLPSRCM